MKPKHLLLASVLLLGGCGGASSSGSSTQALGAASVTIKWPAPTRLIPAASESITLTFSSGTTPVASQTVARPASGGSETVTFSTLPVGNLNLTAQAFPTTSGSGVAQASATETVTIANGQNTPASITMASTIVGFHITSSSTGVEVGNMLTLTATAYDGNNATVLTSPSTISWSSSNTAVATVTNAGVVTGLTTGTSTLTVTDSESGSSSSVTVSVTPTSGGVNVTVQ